MDPILVVIFVLAVPLLLVCAYMEWVGLLSLVTPRRASRYDGCGHVKTLPQTDSHGVCCSCRHERLRHPLHPSQARH